MSRYFRRTTAVNSSKHYRDILKKRGRRRLEQYRTPRFPQYDIGILDSFETYNYIFSPGDTFWKIAHIIYGDSNHWWVIAAFNRKPTIAHLQSGDVIRVPVDISVALEILEG